MSPTLANRKFGELATPFLAAGLLDLTDVHVVDRIAAGTDVDDPEILLGLAFAVRAPRAGHTGVDLSVVRDALTPVVAAPAPGAAVGAVSGPSLEPVPEDPTEALPWPLPGADWHRRVGACSLVGVLGGKMMPFVQSGHLLQTTRMAGYEGRLAAALQARAGLIEDAGADVARLRSDLHRLFPDAAPDDAQKLAGAIAVLARTTVVSGGPGTGKTTTVRKVLGALYNSAVDAGGRAPRVALAAPTGKAAARMREALLQEKPAGLDDAAWAWMGGLTAVTMHRLLGYQPRSPSRFSHGTNKPLPYDVVVVDEASMIDVAMMCKLVEAVAPEARLILLGDRNQLASVEAGSVLADLTAITGATGIRLPPAASGRIEELLGAAAVAGRWAPDAPTLASGMVHFTKAFRFKEEALRVPIYALADASADATLEAEHLEVAYRALVASGTPVVTHKEHTDGRVDDAVVARVVAAYEAAIAPLRHRPKDPGVQAEALRAADEIRVLCAHRRGALGVSGLNDRISAALKPTNAEGEWWVGRLILVTENDYEHRLWNGDVGLATRDERGWCVAFPTADGARMVPVRSLRAYETAFAMTIHKSQGSQFTHAVVVLPEAVTSLLTRELIYTGISRARAQLTVCGSADVLRAAMSRRVQRASGLAERLWA